MLKSHVAIRVSAFLFLAAICFSVSPARAQVPTIAANGVRNGASYSVPGLPNSSIAQGSIMVIFGDNLGPASLVQVASFPLPTSAGLAGTSVSVTVGKRRSPPYFRRTLPWDRERYASPITARAATPRHLQLWRVAWESSH